MKSKKQKKNNFITTTMWKVEKRIISHEWKLFMQCVWIWLTLFFFFFLVGLKRIFACYYNKCRRSKRLLVWGRKFWADAISKDCLWQIKIYGNWLSWLYRTAFMFMHFTTSIWLTRSICEFPFTQHLHRSFSFARSLRQFTFHYQRRWNHRRRKAWIIQYKYIYGTLPLSK